VAAADDDVKKQAQAEIDGRQGVRTCLSLGSEAEEYVQLGVTSLQYFGDEDICSEVHETMCYPKEIRYILFKLLITIMKFVHEILTPMNIT